MNVIKTITLSQIKKAPHRFLVTVIGVIISAAMLTATFVSYFSIVELMKSSVVANSGPRHFTVAGKYSESLQSYIDNSVFKTKAIQTPPLYLKMDNIDNYVSFSKVYGDYVKLFSIELLEGALPQNEAEALIGKTMQESSGYKIGDTITVPQSLESYKISGIIEDPYLISGKNAEAVLMYSRPQQGENVMAAAMYSEITQSNVDYSLALAQQMLPPEETDYVSPHHSYLQYCGIKKSADNSSNMIGMYEILNGIAVIAVIIVILASVLMVYNSFSISTAERRKMLGMLSSIGATPWQKKGFIFYEAGLVGVIGIPIGVASGVLGITVTLYLLQNTLASIFDVNPSMFGPSINLKTVLFSVLFSVITLLISAYLPSITASRVSPIEAVRSIGAIKYKPRSAKGIIRKIFGFEGKLAEINMKRSYRRYAATLLSLTAAVVLLISALGPISLIESSYRSVNGDNLFNLNATLYFDKGEDYSQQEAPFKEIAAQSSKTYQRWKARATVNSKPEDILSKGALKLLDSDLSSSETELVVQVIAVPNDEYKKLSGEESLENGCVILNRSKVMANNSMHEIVDHTACKTNDVLSLKFGDEFSSSLRVAKVTNEKFNAFGLDFSPPHVITAIISKDAFDGLIKSGLTLYDYAWYYNVKNEDLIKLESQLHRLSGKDISMSVQKIENFNRTAAALLIIKVFTLGFVALIGLVSAANISNTIYTSVLLRKRELAMIKSVGLEQSRINKMVFLEGALYAIKALLIGVPLGVAIFVMEHLVLKGIIYSPLSLPFGAIALSAVGVAAVTMLSSLPAMNQIKKTPINEMLRSDAE